MILWSAGILLALGTVWFVVAVVLPVWQVKRALASHRLTGSDWIIDVSEDEAFVSRLGGQSALASKIGLFLRMPRAVAGDRYLAAYSLRYGGIEALPAIRKALLSAAPEVRSGALRASAHVVLETGDNSLLPMIFAALSDPAVNVRVEAAEVLAYLAGLRPAIAQELKAFLEGARVETRSAAAAALWPASEDGRRPLSTLLSALQDTDHQVRHDAALVLGHLGPCAKAAMAPREAATEDADSKTREATRFGHDDCLGRHVLVDRSDAVDRVFSLMTDPDWEVRSRTAILLGEANCWLEGDLVDEAAAVLRRALRDENRCVSACAAYGLSHIRPDPLTPRGVLTIEMEYDDEKRGIQYAVGNGRPILGEAALAKELARRVKRRGEPPVCHIATRAFGLPVLQRELDAAIAACKAAGATVAEMPKPLSDDKVRIFRTGGRSAEMVLGAVGVRNGTIQFRLDGRLAEGKAGVLQVFRERVAQIEQEKGGPTGIYIDRRDVPELRMPEDRWLEVFEALREACPYVEDVWSQSGGRRRRTVPGPDGKPIPADLPVEVRILGPGEGGNRYQIEGRTFEGETALSAELKRRLAEFRSGKEGPGRFALSVRLRVEVGPGVTVTEEQLTLARKTVADSGVNVPEKPEADK